jgi:5-methylcytosine-specific restriction endonuclease McrA
MQESVLDKPIVLCLNRGWQVIGYKSPKQAICAMHSTENGEDMAAQGVAIDYPKLEDDVYTFEEVENMRSVSLKDWMELPVRPFDNVIRCAHGRLIRCPTVVVAVNCNRMPKKQKRLSNASIHERDGYICQYSGKKLTRAEISVDHIIPRDVWRREGRVGSPDVWTNMVTCEKNINHNKGNRLNEEVGLKLIRQPKAPMPVPVSALITEIRQRDHAWFIG